MKLKQMKKTERQASCSFSAVKDSYRRHNAEMAVNGILEDELTIAEMLRAKGYRTGMFGKWHLGDCSPHLPNDKGFEYFFGAHYFQRYVSLSLLAESRDCCRSAV